jgi:hypothetical protein
MHVQYVSCETQRDIQNHSREYERGTRGRRHTRRQGSTEVVRRSRGSVSITRRSPCFLIRSAHNADWLPMSARWLSPTKLDTEKTSPPTRHESPATKSSPLAWSTGVHDKASSRTPTSIVQIFFLHIVAQCTVSPSSVSTRIALHSSYCKFCATIVPSAAVLLKTDSLVAQNARRKMGCHAFCPP